MDTTDIILPKSCSMVEQSNQIDKLAAAFVKAQSVLQPAQKDAVNTHFKSKFADLASVTRAIQGPLAENGLAILQFGRIRNGGRELFTMLLHSSGQWIGGALPLNPAKDEPQALKAAITYMRRAGIESITGLATEDDDGNSASHPAIFNTSLKPAVGIDYSQSQKPPIALQREEALAGVRDATKSHHPISEAQLNRLFVIAKKAGWDVNDVNVYVKKAFGVATTEIPRYLYDNVWKYVESSPPPKMFEEHQGA